LAPVLPDLGTEVMKWRGFVIWLIVAFGCIDPAGPYSVHLTVASLHRRVIQDIEGALLGEGYSFSRTKREYGKEVTTYSKFTDGNSRFWAAWWSFAYSADSLTLRDFDLGVNCGQAKELLPEVKAEVDRIVEVLYPILLKGVEADSLKKTVYERDRK